jgi:hypothetical protein
MQDLKQLLIRLLKYDVDFVLIGGFAGVVHGTTLVTQDLDICAAITDSLLIKLRDALKDLHPQHRMNPNLKISFLEQPRDSIGVNNLYLHTDLGVLDILSEAPPVGEFARIKKAAVTIDLYGFKCSVIAIEDLIRIKKSMKRPKDQHAAEQLEIILKEKNISK